MNVYILGAAPVVKLYNLGPGIWNIGKMRLVLQLFILKGSNLSLVSPGNLKNSEVKLTDYLL